jgi:hypothetical protein
MRGQPVSRHIRATVKIDLADSCGTGRPVNCAAVAAVLVRRAREAPASAATLTALADAIRAGTGLVTVRIDATAEQADAVRDAIAAAAQAETDGRRPAADLAHIRRSWEIATGFAGRPAHCGFQAYLGCTPTMAEGTTISSSDGSCHLAMQGASTGDTFLTQFGGDRGANLVVPGVQAEPGYGAIHHQRARLTMTARHRLTLQVRHGQTQPRQIGKQTAHQRRLNLKLPDLSLGPLTAHGPVLAVQRGETVGGIVTKCCGTKVLTPPDEGP